MVRPFGYSGIGGYPNNSLGGGLLKFTLVMVALALVAGAILGGAEFLNPKRTQAQVEQQALENERIRAEIAYQEELRQIELEKQRKLAQEEVEAYPETIKRRAEAIEVAIMVVGGTLAAGILVVSSVATYYILKRANQVELANQRLLLLPSATTGRRSRPSRKRQLGTVERAA